MTIHARIALHALQKPGAHAVSVDGRKIGYREFWRAIGTAARHVAASRIAPGRNVVIAFGSDYHAYLGVLACQLAGHPVAAVKPEFLRDVGRLQAARLFTDRADIALRANKSEHLPDGWPEGGGSEHPPPSDCPIGADSLAQVFFTSGTTARSKMIPYTRRQLEFHVEQNVARYGHVCASRYLSLVGAAHGQGVGRNFAVWHAGGTVIIESRMNPAEAIVRHEPDSVHVYPALLSRILERLPADWRPRERVRVRVGGSRLSPELHAIARRFPGLELEGSYGTGETFTAGLIEPVPAGAPWPDDYETAAGVDLEVVDPSDHPLPAGQAGVLRIRSPGTVGAYLGAPDLSAKHFRNGWFYPGDIALIAPSGRFRILGRESEMLDLGGMKTAPEPLDDAARAIPGVRDAAVFSLTGRSGIGELWVAVVPESGADAAAMLNEIRRRFSAFSRLSTLKCAEIPRNENGKVERRKLADRVAARARER